MILEKPSVLILSGSRSIMSKIIEGFNNALQTGTKPENYFGSYEYTSKNKQPIGKYVVKKIASLIEAQEDNNLFDPHFKGFADNTYNRGGECFYRIDGNSATLDEKFYHLLELCTFWEPEFHISNCSGIKSIDGANPYNMTITSDFAFKFTTGVRKEQLDSFWLELIIPMILEDDYSNEEKQCKDKAKEYAKNLKNP